MNALIDDDDDDDDDPDYNLTRAAGSVVASIMAFARYYSIETQMLPQCCKFLANELVSYHMYLQQIDLSNDTPVHVINDSIVVNDDGFIKIVRTSVLFDMNCLHEASPPDIDYYIDFTRKQLSPHDKKLFKLLARDRWYKGDFVRLKKILTQSDVGDLIAFACNVIWERGYENNYTLGQQLSIRITTKLIQCGLDFKHQTGREEKHEISRGWNDNGMEKMFNSITSISDVIKRHRCCKKYIVLEVLKSDCQLIRNTLSNYFTLIYNANVNNVCAIEIDADKNSHMYLKKFMSLLQNKLVNVVFVTDVDYYMKQNNFMFYLYNSLKMYYYCLTNKFVFELQDYEIIFLLNLILSLEWHNGGHLNSFTLEKSSLYNPLELSTRRLNSIKRAATQSRTLHNDSEIKIDFIKGKRIKTGTHYGRRLVRLTSSDENDTTNNDSN
ncbi:P47 [Trabala vishnou gigantina nucleopolyhedrovirus]|uniref:P47 n=1 Tax=Trabala vishnou gigantina nucleopolyhedrovirus TaxID=2863583 RepID=UPI002481B866|nr:P47 [Trabala vishnou gigantina nucleopolyhedrovirus]QYC92676.1 P47 [Trabala vishnou gigantina nucleopolyhedrovirus]